ncbi:hypothetical protein ACFFK0_02935 [Paenibacillus chartarius]|uniref:Uncharacterized protein n=1 Tax=Paenibacillus chartarius TaxID=747481 RepID=A0ABV6DFM7_9BACL
MTTKTVERKTDREGKGLFIAMHIAAWAALAIGLLLCVTSLNHFSDTNSSLMTGIGFMVGSVFIYMIGTAMNLVHKRNTESES